LETAREEFIEMISEINRIKGLDALSSKLIGVLFIEPEEISLERLTELTGYSLSAISTSMKFIEKTGFVKRIKKPKSRKVYYFMEKGLIDSFLDVMEGRFMTVMETAREKTPEILEKYRKVKKKSEKAKKEQEIVEIYNKEINIVESIFKQLVEDLKTEKKKLVEGRAK